MATAVKMPALGESVTEGTVTTWLKKVGDTVAADEPIVEVSTDKVDSEVPSPVAGTLLEILVDEDETVEVGTEIARIGDASEAGGSSAPESSSEASSPEAASTAPEAAPVADVVPDEPTEPSSSPEPAAQQGGSTAEATDVKMPALGESVTEGTVTTWLKKVGDTVAADEPIVEVSTDKVDSEVPSPVAGTLLEILVDEDETVEVGTVIARVGDSSAAPAPTTQDAPAPAQEEPAPTPHEPESQAAAHHAPPAPPAPPTHAQGHVAPPAPPVPHGAVPTPGFPTRESLAPVATAAGRKVEAADVAAVAGGYVTPIVRKFARELGVDLAGVTGTGIGGRIRREDVQAAADAAKASAPSDTSAAPARPAAPALEVSPLRGTTEKMTRLRQTVARRMVESLQTAAQLTTVVEVDVTRIAALRARSKNAFLEKKGTKLTFLPFFVKAATESLLYHPKLNATIDGKEVTFFDHEHVGIAVDTERGLMVPVIKDAGDKSLADIAHSINDLAARTRDGKISPDELSGSTFTITNTGSGGALFDTPILNMPETAILGVGTIVKRPVVVKDADGNETIGIRSMVYLALSYDHRLVDGADAARYLQTLKKRLEEGAFEADLEL